jgi:hypothetical protein
MRVLIRSKFFVLVLALLSVHGNAAKAEDFDLKLFENSVAPATGAATGESSEQPAHSRGTFSFPTYSQNAVFQPTYLGKLAPVWGPVGFNKLPTTQLDSFVHNAGASADLIYGDEGTDGPPPYSEFTPIHRIDAGIHGSRAAGLTTGHRSKLPSAWGRDEFLGAEWSEPSSK